MPNRNTAGLRSLPGVLFAVLFAVVGLAACSGGGGSTTSANTTNTADTTNTTVTTYTITASTGANGTVTPSGATTVAQGASQSYSITPGAGYAIATLVVDGATVATSSTHTFTNVQANHTISATFSAAAPGGIVLSLVPARSSGVAPLAVFFDASATTDIGVTTRPFHDLEYTWSFGDPNSGTWPSGAQPGVSSKNSATGPVAAHVFETPGTYTVTLTAFDGTNTVTLTAFDGTNTATTNTTITVQDPDVVFAGTNTICVGATALPTAGTGGCPAGASTVQESNFATAINTYALTGKRVLFKRGDTFTEMASANAWLKVTGPGIIGAFGTNAEISAGIKPKVQIDFTGIAYNVPFLTLGSSNAPGIEDWRIMDLEFDGQSQSKTQGTYPSGGFNKFTFLRMHMHHIYSGIMLDDQALDFINTPVNKGHTIFGQIAIVDSTITPYASPFGWRIYIAAKHLSIIGNTLGNVADSTSMASHIIRARYVGKGVISNNTLARSGSAMLAIKLHAPAWCDATSPVGTCLVGDGTALATPTYSYLTNTQPIGVSGVTNGYTEQVIISDNEIIGSGSPYLVDIGPQNTFMDERVRDVIVERNWFKEGATQTAVVISGYEITARNNICNLTGGANQRYCFNAKRYGPVSPARPPENIWVYNNTAYSGDASGGSQSFALVRVEFDVTNVIARNNLAYAPLAGAGLYHLIDDSNACGAACITASNNSTDNQVKNTFPGWVSATPSVPADFSLTAGSYARDAGFAVPVWSDFFRTSRPQNGVIDMGAVERP